MIKNEVRKADDVKEYAGGWMTERKDTDAPLFLKLAFAVIGLFCVSYLLVYMNGEVNHAERGVLVRQFNEATYSASSSPFMYVIAALGLVYVVLVVSFAIRKFKHED
jgi:hypothetical protein